MNNLKFEMPTLNSFKTTEELDKNHTRYTPNEYGMDKEVITKSQCIVCDENIWVIDNHNRSTLLVEAFKILDSRCYKDNITPDYLKKSNVLLQCHWSCKENLEKQLSNGTFISR